MKAVILAGGLGTRLAEETSVRPKPMVEVGGHPILWHIMKIYSAHGVNDFVVCCGYKGYVIKEYFASYFLRGADVTFDLEKNQIIEWYTNEPGHLAFITGGNNVGRVAQVLHVERHLGGFDIVHLKDANGKTFSTRKGNCFIIGNKKPSITLPEGDGKYLNILEEKAVRDDKKRKPSAAK